MNINDLKLFMAVAFHGNFTKAAEASYTVQSNVTARIKSLEEEFDTKLFLRTSRKVELTSAGETLLHYSKQIINLIEEAKISIGKNDIVNGQIKIGFLETTMYYLTGGSTELNQTELPNFLFSLAISQHTHQQELQF